MWKLSKRGARGTPFEDVGSYASLTDVAEATQKIENNNEGIFFRIWVDPINPLSPANDAEAFSDLDYQTRKHYYSLTRSAN